MIYQVGIDVPVDAPRAVKLYRGLCDGGDRDACADLGWFLTDPGPQHDVPAGLALMTKTCDGGGARACDLLALRKSDPDPSFHDTSEIIATLEARAAKLYRQACEAGTAEACGELEPEGPDAKALLALIESSCKRGFAAACSKLGALHVFGKQDASGAVLVPQDSTKAIELLEGSCTSAGRGCRFLAELYDGDRPHTRLEAIRRLACDAWDATSCWKLGNHARACDLGHATACTEIGRTPR